MDLYAPSRGDWQLDWQVSDFLKVLGVDVDPSSAGEPELVAELVGSALCNC